MDNTVSLQTRLHKIRLVLIQNFVKRFNSLIDLRRDHADQPVIKRTRQTRDEKCRTGLPRLQVCPRKSEKTDLTGLFHRHLSFRSASLYSGPASSSIPHNALPTENSLHWISSFRECRVSSRVRRNPTKSRTSCWASGGKVLTSFAICSVTFMAKRPHGYLIPLTPLHDIYIVLKIDTFVKAAAYRKNKRPFSSRMKSTDGPVSCQRRESRSRIGELSGHESALGGKFR